MKDNNKQRIKAGDYIAVREKKWDDKTQWSAWTRITRVLSVKNGEVTHTRYDRVWTSDICNCVKLSKEEVEKYCEMKGSRDMVDGLGDEIEKWISESSEKIKVGDKIGTNYEDKSRGCRRHYEKYDYVVLGESKDLIVCTRPNKNRDIYIFPRCNCYIKGDDAAETEPEEDESCEIDLEDESCGIDLDDEPYEIDLGDDDYYTEV